MEPPTISQVTAAPTASDSGRALVLSARPAVTYRADVTISGDLIHGVNVQLRRGAGDDAWYGPASDRTWSARHIREVRWLADGASA